MQEERTLEEELRAALSRRGWQPVDLARASGVDQSTVSRNLAGKKRPSLETLQAYARALNLSYRDLRRRAGYDPEEPRTRPSAQEAIIEEMDRTWEELTQEDLEDLWHILDRVRRRRRRETQRGGKA